MSDLRPGFVPYNESTSTTLRDDIQERVAALLAPYMDRAIEFQIEERNNPSSQDLADVYEEADRSDTLWEQTAYVTAISEALADLMHEASKRKVAFSQCLSVGMDQYQTQAAGMARYLVYGALPETPPPGAER